MKRFLTTFGLLILGLIALATGVNAALERVGTSASLTSMTVCDECGMVVFAYNGNLDDCRATIKANAAPGIHFIHRT